MLYASSTVGLGHISPPNPIDLTSGMQPELDEELELLEELDDELEDEDELLLEDEDEPPEEELL